ncbi:suppressor protein SRP40 [Nymphaea colorata]|nr:suppressor protein SRP40 [Nymphaea colorata]
MSALVSMEPRNVMLEKKKTKKKKTREEKEAEVNNEGEVSVGTELAGLLESKPVNEGLLRAIASFLERHGFSKALSALQLEAQGLIDNSLTNAIRLEHVYYKYLKDGCALSTDGQFSGLKEKDSLGGLQINVGKSEVIASKEVNNRKRSNGIEIDMLNFCDPEVDHSNKVLLGDSSVMRPAAKEKKRKKHRKISDDCNVEDTKQVENEMSCKFGNLGDALENVKFVCTGLDGKSKDTIVLLTMPKHGKKKKKKSYTCQEEDASLNHGKASQEGFAEKFNDSLTSKVANVNALQDSSYTVSLNETCLSNKNKKKKSKSTFDGLCCEAVSSLNASEVHANGNIEDKELEGHTAETHKKGSKGSAEPKTVNAFRRVNPDEITFADERLQNNSYWAKGGAESGYGARAQEVLGQVRGKDFRHEKTKKKRGSYRGGLIDLQSHSIKFSYSDDE